MKTETVQEKTTSHTVGPTVALVGMTTQIERAAIKTMDTLQPQHYTTDRVDAADVVIIRLDGGMKRDNNRTLKLSDFIFISNSIIPLNINKTTSLILDTWCSGHYDRFKKSYIKLHQCLAITRRQHDIIVHTLSQYHFLTTRKVPTTPLFPNKNNWSSLDRSVM